MQLRSLAPVVEATLSLAALGAAGERLAGLFRDSGKLLVITGAGVSTRSGIPDYRSPGRPQYKPLQHADFMSSEPTRRRYWARSTLGWSRMGSVRPNLAHTSLARLQELAEASAERVHACCTQNVDRLHHAAGHRGVLELHGTIHEVECLACSATWPRSHMQDAMLVPQNAAWVAEFAPLAQARPDGDVELPDEAYSRFVVPACEHCGGTLVKPCVVFFGGSIPAPVRDASLEWANTCDAAVALGTTLTTYSAFRLARRVAERGKPLAVVNCGPTRADPLASVRLEGHDVGSVLAAVLSSLKGHAS